MQFINRYKYTAAFFSALMLDFWFNMGAYIANHNFYILAIIVNLTYPFVSMLPILLIIEEKEFKNKVKIALVEGIGYVFSSVIFIAFFKSYFDKIN